MAIKKTVPNVVETSSEISSDIEGNVPKRAGEPSSEEGDPARRGAIVNDADRVSQDPADDGFLGPPEVLPSHADG